ncbi:class I SAM-dependent methyltransferase [Rhodocytophaga aerolata]|uniref:Class I SAM-dependent methyltransferase n=1 Tax=Rhodocytophaga aerolata TaxID=455078 RepID=A0ABT8RBQ4_9BACT|nr:class I SAM-dependent methyltransferase [Rhodocytophaga aerolata]MDO1449526.1 class I SAM-dependent methyltransferase [Rhodocytophaga aerolata]
MITCKSKPSQLKDRREKNNVAATSIKQVPRLFKIAQFLSGTTNLDLGAGKYAHATSYLRKLKVKNLRYDPYSLPFEINQSTACQLTEQYVDTVTISNTLNVIEKKDLRLELLQTAYKHLKKGGQCYITIYEGNGTGKGKITGRGTYQANREMESYLPEIATVFKRYALLEGIIICKK